MGCIPKHTIPGAEQEMKINRWLCPSKGLGLVTGTEVKFCCYWKLSSDMDGNAESEQFHLWVHPPRASHGHQHKVSDYCLLKPAGL